MTDVFYQQQCATPEISTANTTVNPQTIHSYSHLVVHYGELALKGRNRHLFEQRLIDELSRRACTIGPARVRKLSGRVLIEFAAPAIWGQLAQVARNTFGLANAHGMCRVRPDISAIEGAALECAAATTFSSFAVRCRRGEKSFPMTSQDVCVRIGRRIEETTGARVDLTAPEWTCWIEIMSEDAFVGAHRVEGPGGLPVGISGKVAALLSGGIDSPVAAWRMMRRGCRIVFIHFHSAPFTSAASREKVVELARRLSVWQGNGRLALVPFGSIQQQVVASVPDAYRIIVYRRLMIRIAQAIAGATGCEALVTGESLGQVASQTLSNMATIENVSELPVLRPLVGMDKQEITDEAKSIGTYDVSIEPYDDCCTFLEPSSPATRSRAKELDTVERQLDVAHLVDEGVSKTEWHDIS